MRFNFSFLILISLLTISCEKEGPGGKGATPKSEEEKTFYAVGAMFGKRLKDLRLGKGEVEMVVSGLKDGIFDRDLKVDTNAYSSKVQEVFRKRLSAKSDEEKKKGVTFLEKFLKEKGAKKTSSGLAYKIVAPGKGNSPKPTDTVEVHYTGKLIDGTVFDSSRERGKTVSFPLNRVIKGWTEGLQLIKPGGRIELVIPSDLGYGDHGAAPKIPGGATLVFDVELLGIQPPKAKSSKKKSPKKSLNKKPAPKKK
ncbi:MAG: FKBP-type peptidyl-prolyl cis-trans isomerase [Bacteriovoracales bacterium]|nr:FKBP-type peptidyl-prolyl cis-trans isomerase [Bacteriovoracales bacterium]